MIEKINEEVLRIISKYSDDIAQGIFTLAYKEIENTLGPAFVGQFTELLLDSKIDPLERVKKIPDSYLWGADVKEISIPHWIEQIGMSAFMGCNNVESVAVPGNVSQIGFRAFGSCKSLTEAIIEEGTDPVTLEAQVFSYCTALKYLTLPKKTLIIDNRLLWHCEAIEEIEYGGTKEQWNSIGISAENEELFNCAIHCSDGKLEKGWRKYQGV